MSATQTIQETWKPAAGFEGRYEISDQGRVKTLLRHRGQQGMILKTLPNKDGYPFVSLSNGNGGHASRTVHRLVLDAFVGPCPPNKECSHRNGVRSDCRLVNLEWATEKENQAMRRVHGTTCQGSRNRLAKLSESDVMTIREMISSGSSMRSLSRKYGVTFACISLIKNRKNWRHI